MKAIEGKDLDTQKEGNTMELAKNGFISNGAIPPLDASMPSQTEIATFALG